MPQFIDVKQINTKARRAQKFSQLYRKVQSCFVGNQRMDCQFKTPFSISPFEQFGYRKRDRQQDC